MSQLGTAYVDVKPDFSGFSTAVGREIDAASPNAAAKTKGMGLSMGKGLLAGFAVAGIGALIKGISASVDAYEEARKVANQTNAVIKSTGGAAKISAKEVGDLASAISKKAGIDDEAIQSGENLLLTFKDIRNEAGSGNDIFNQTTQIMVDMSAAMGQDMKSSAIQLGKALNDPAKGMTALTRVGVTFTDQQKAQIKALQASGDTMGAQKIILRELNSEFGGSAAAQATATDKLNVTFGNLAEKIGSVLVPILDKFASWLDKFLNSPGFKKFAQDTLDAFNSVIDWFKTSGAWDFIQKTVEKVFNNMVDVVQILARALKGLIDFISGVFSGDWSKAWGGVKEIFSAAWDLIGKVVSQQIEIFKTVGSAIGNAILDGFKALGGLIAAAATWFKDQLVNGLKSALSFFTNIGNWILQQIVAGFENVAGLVTGAATWFKDTMVRGITNIANFFKNLGNQILGYISTGFQVAGSVFTDIANWVKDRLVNAINAIAAIFKSIGQTILGFLATGLKVAGSVFSDIAEWVKDRLVNAINAIGGLFRNIGNAILGFLATGFKVAGDLFSGIADWFYDRLTNAAKFIAGKFKGIGGDIVGWIVEGLRGAGKLVQGFFNDVIHVVNVPLKFLGLGTIGDIKIFGAARGDIIGGSNVVEGFSTGGEVRRGTRLTKPMIMMGEEAPKHPEYVIPTNPAYRDRALKLYEALGQEIHAYAGGGILDTPGRRVKNLPSTIGGLFGGKNPVQEALDKMPAIPAMPTWMHGIAREIKEKVIDWLKDKVAGLFSAGDPATGAGFTGGRLQLPSAFNPTHQTAGLPGYPAIDVFAAPGSAVLSPITGTVTRRSGRDPKFGAYQGAGGPFGWSLYLSDGVHSYFLTHFGSIGVAVGEKIKAGQYLGTVGDYPGSVPDHIHEGRTGYAQGGIIQGPFVGSFANGGMVQATGLAQVHAGEVITPAGQRPSEVRVFIGERELTDIVRVEVDGQRRGSAAQFRAGSHR